jgi:hypothetical protein
VHQKSILEEEEFLHLLSIAKGRPASKSLPSNIQTASQNQFTVDEIRSIISRHGVEMLPADLFSKLAPEEIGKLSDEELFLLSDATQGAKANKGLIVPHWYSPSFILQAALPARALPKGTTQFHTINNAIETTISVPIESKGSIEIPSAMAGRVTGAWLTTQILAGCSERLYIDGLKKSFVENALQIKATTGADGTARSYPNAIEGWAKSVFQFTKCDEHTGKIGMYGDILDLEKYASVPVADGACLWKSRGFSRSDGGYIDLSSRFMDLTLEHAVPVDFKVLTKVIDTKSPYAFDLFWWCIYRVHQMRMSGEGITRMNWTQYRQQMLGQIRNNSAAFACVEGALKALSKKDIELPISISKTSGMLIKIPPAPIVGSISPRQTSLI